MRTQWQCYSWQGLNGVPEGEPTETWSSPEGAVEFLRRELTVNGLYSKQVLLAALADLRKGGPMTLDNELPGGKRLWLMIRPVEVTQ